MAKQVKLSASLEMCKLAEVISPHCIFLNRILHISHSSFSTYHEDLRATYGSQSNDYLTLDKSTSKVGSLCAAKIGNDFYRGLILRTDEVTCIVKLVDYGGFYEVSMKDLRVLLPRFVKYPFQAVETVLAYVSPFHESDGRLMPYSEEVMSYLYNLKNSNVMARSIFEDFNGTQFIELYRFTEEGSLVNVAEDLASKNLLLYLP